MEKDLKLARAAATLLDNRFEIFGIRFGFNTLFEFIPGMGDIVAGVLSLYIIFLGTKMNVPQSVKNKMITNVALSIGAGLIPFVGDAFYLFYKPNVRNVKLLDEYIKSTRIPQNISATL